MAYLMSDGYSTIKKEPEPLELVGGDFGDQSYDADSIGSSYQAKKRVRRKTCPTKSNWSDTQTQNLIDAVRAEATLWDQSVPDYRQKEKRHEAWTNISKNTFNGEIRPFELSAKWQNLRCQYKDHCNKLRRSMTATGEGQYLVRWKYFNEMKFLSSENPWESSKYLSLTMYTNEDDSCAVTEDDDASSVEKRHKPSSDSISACTPTTSRNDTALEVALRCLQKVPDDAQIFADFIASAIRELPTLEKQRELKRALNRTLLDFQEDQDN